MENKSTKAGSIHLILGPMYSGKSTELIRIANQYKSIGKKILAINNKRDTRYGNNKIISHDKLSINCIMVTSLDEILSDEKYYQEFKNADIILIEELQFFDNIDFITGAADIYNKKIVASGLDGDYLRKPFKSVIDLIPHSDNITKLKSFCKKCSDGTPGIFSKRIVDSTSTILVGGEETYISVCRKCYLEE